MITPSIEEFYEYSAKAKIIPVVCKLNADTFTPISIFQKFGMEPNSFMLESVEGGERWGRYSLMGRDPLLYFESKKEETAFTVNGRRQELAGNPMERIREICKEFESGRFPYVDHFYCGLLGYFGYDFVRYCEKLPDHLPDELNLPDCRLMAPREVIVFDHLRSEMTIIVNALAEEGSAGYAHAVERVGAIMAEIMEPAPQKTIRGGYGELHFESRTPKADYCRSIEKSKQYIKDGDIFQVVISQRFTSDFHGDTLAVYRALRSVNPSPYLFYLNYPDCSIIGASPEMLVRLQNGKVENCPIAGTRPRGATPEEDLALEQSLLADEKEKSEHYMLVDLGRNDVGKVSKFGTVQVKNLAHIERFSHVMHIVTNLEGIKREDAGAVDVLASILPAGTLSGAPKVRAMEIIEELEPVRRGVYGGAIGYLGFDGDMDTCIAIRTAVIKDGKIHVQAGGGIVADSEPEKEYQETVNKSRALFTALEKAGGIR